MTSRIQRSLSVAAHHLQHQIDWAPELLSWQSDLLLYDGGELQDFSATLVARCVASLRARNRRSEVDERLCILVKSKPIAEGLWAVLAEHLIVNAQHMSQEALEFLCHCLTVILGVLFESPEERSSYDVATVEAVHVIVGWRLDSINIVTLDTMLMKVSICHKVEEIM